MSTPYWSVVYTVLAFATLCFLTHPASLCVQGLALRLESLALPKGLVGQPLRPPRPQPPQLRTLQPHSGPGGSGGAHRAMHQGMQLQCSNHHLRLLQSLLVPGMALQADVG